MNNPLENASTHSKILPDLNQLVWLAEEVGSSRNLDVLSIKSPTSSCLSIPFGLPEIDLYLPGGGLPLGTVHEIINGDESSLHPRSIPALFARSIIDIFYKDRSKWHKDPFPAFIIWIGRSCWPTPLFLDDLLALPIVSSSGTKDKLLSKCLFIDPPSEELTLWSIETAIRSKAAPLIIAACPNIPLPMSMRLSLAAKKSSSLVVLLRSHKERKAPTAAMSRWIVKSLITTEKEPVWELILDRIKGCNLSRKRWHVGIAPKISNLTDELTKDEIYEYLSGTKSFAASSAPPFHILSELGDRVSAEREDAIRSSAVG